MLSGTTKVLGMLWQTDSDKLAFQPPLKVEQKTNTYTKRDVVKITSSVFDPLGIISPVHVKAKNIYSTPLGYRIKVG